MATQKESWETELELVLGVSFPGSPKYDREQEIKKIVRKAILSSRKELIVKFEDFQKEDAALTLPEDSDDFEYFHGCRIGVEYAIAKVISITKESR